MIIIQANGAEGDLEEKILALLRREDIAAERVSLSSRHTLTFPELTIDGRSQQAFQNGTALALTRIEFNMLLFLASNPGVTLSKEDLFSAVWGRDSAEEYFDFTCAEMQKRRLLTHSKSGAIVSLDGELQKRKETSKGGIEG